MQLQAHIRDFHCIRWHECTTPYLSRSRFGHAIAAVAAVLRVPGVPGAILEHLGLVEPAAMLGYRVPDLGHRSFGASKPYVLHKAYFTIFE